MAARRMRRSFLVPFVGALVLAGLASAPAARGALPPGFQESIVFSGLDHPTAVRFSSDGRIFVAEKSGRIKVFDSLTDTSPTLFADLNVDVYNFWDRACLVSSFIPTSRPRPLSTFSIYAYDHELGECPVRSSLGHPRRLIRPLPDSSRCDR